MAVPYSLPCSLPPLTYRAPVKLPVASSLSDTVLSCLDNPTSVRTVVAQLRQVANDHHLKDAMTPGYSGKAGATQAQGGFRALEEDIGLATTLMKEMPAGMTRSAMAAEIKCIEHELKIARDHWQRELGKAVKCPDPQRAQLARQVLGIANTADIAAPVPRMDPGLWAKVDTHQSPMTSALLSLWGNGKLNDALKALTLTASDYYQYEKLNDYMPSSGTRETGTVSEQLATRCPSEGYGGYAGIPQALTDLELALACCPPTHFVFNLLAGMKDQFEAAQAHWLAVRNDSGASEQKALATAWLDGTEGSP